jgi:glycosyltransferase involved in cell wall biosynthesis
MNVTLFVPVLNELEGMKACMPSIPRELFGQILVVDGNSTDGSADWARAQGYDVYVQKGRGIRNAYIEAWPLIRGDYVMTYSPDGNCKNSDMAAIIAKLGEGYDMVIASRYLDGARSEDDTWLTALGNRCFTGAINLLHSGHFTDAMTIYRAYRKSLFYDLDMNKQESYATDNFFRTVSGIEPLLSIRAAKTGIKIGEVPSDEPKRLTGESKLQKFRWGGSFLLQTIRETYFWKKKP